ncbi:PAS domain-containing sensor histidine kinase [Flammeovirga sp. EKP202]|uniref:sensor histidine kinase n=1 Tax=Flammeovirga sp. EKP202 TaxID=2770592 RepID=UPI00165EFDEF|nr:ATP-binding protein [Flammeovirga sp. EKP202]MBD0403157.1 GHKL domain-containing protein [Flammeovirga sp. EKP202]
MKQIFYIKVFIVLFLLITLGGLMVHYQHQPYMLITFGLMCACLLSYQLITLKNALNHSILIVEAIGNEDLSFLNSKNYQQFNSTYQYRLEKIQHSFSRIKKDSIRQEKYLDWIIENQDVGICTYDENGHVLHANSSFKEKINLPVFTHTKQLFTKTFLTKELIQKAFHQNTLELENSNLVLKARQLVREDQTVFLLTLQDISNELEEKEHLSYSKLIRVLTHEIMNGMTPIISLSDSMLMTMTDEEHEPVSLENLNQKVINTNVKSLKVINNQAEGLMNFINIYRSISKLPTPKIREVNVDNFIQEELNSFSEVIHKYNIHTEIINVNNSEVYHSFDPTLIHQCVHNIIKNAIEAMHDVNNSKLTIEFHQAEQLVIHITNNGPMIPEEELKHIFVPFFTTKNKGNGIGLALCKQIARVHKGNLKVESEGNKTCFTLKI